jgi:hypothetical protein
MPLWTIMAREILHRKLTFLLGLIGVAAAVALVIGVLTSVELHDVRAETLISQKEAERKASMARLQAEVKRAMHRLGYNAIVLPKDQPLGDWYAEDYATKTMPEEVASALAETEGLVDRYLPRLRQKLKWQEHAWTVIVVGVGRERILDDSVCEDEPLVEAIEDGTCRVGSELHHALDLDPGDEITLRGRRLRIVECDEALGTKDDITIWVNLDDAQKLLDKPGRINEILVVEHLSVWGNLPEVRRRMARVLPDCQVIEIASETMSRAHARIETAEEARATAEREREQRADLQRQRRRVLMTLVPAALLASAVWIGFLMYLNVKERVVEIGALMAIGFAPGKVRRLVISKALLLGAAGAAVGFLLGTGIALTMDSVAQADVSLRIPTLLKYAGLALSIGLTACILGSWIPARSAAATDPAEVLRGE